MNRLTALLPHRIQRADHLQVDDAPAGARRTGSSSRTMVSPSAQSCRERVARSAGQWSAVHLQRRTEPAAVRRRGSSVLRFGAAARGRRAACRGSRRRAGRDPQLQGRVEGVVPHRTVRARSRVPATWRAVRPPRGTAGHGRPPIPNPRRAARLARSSLRTPPSTGLPPPRSRTRSACPRRSGAPPLHAAATCGTRVRRARRPRGPAAELIHAGGSERARRRGSPRPSPARRPV